MRRLLPSYADAVHLDDAYAYPAGRPWLRANMVASADGAATAGGRSGGLSGEADRQVFSVLRGLADVVLVGAATVRREEYGPPKAKPQYAERRAAAGQAPAPVIAIVSGSLDLDFTSKLFAAATTTPIVITAAAAPPGRMAAAGAVADVVVAGDERVDLSAAADALAGRGYRRMLTEGGPHLLSQLVAAGLVDELCLTIAPLMVGGDVALRIVAGAQLDPPMPLHLAHLLEDANFLFARYLTTPPGVA
jgi:riboflavin-specific deaminase-like protein